MTIGLDIVVVSFNTKADLRTCLTSIEAHPPSCAYEIHVVDNASTDGSPEMVRAEFPAVRLHASARNLGFAAANNLAIRNSSQPFVLLLNPDTEVTAGALDRLLDRLHATGAVAVGPRLVDRDGHPEISWGPMLSPLAEARQAFRVWLARQPSRWARRRVARLLSREREVDWITGACLLVQRDAAEAVGLLDERYFMYEEDVDFCAALRARGGRILFTPSAQIVHARGRSFSSGRTSASPLYDRSHLTFYEKHAPRWVPLLRAWLSLRGRRRER